ncbi:O-antigen ligase family protein [Desulfoplanes sp.]
MLFLNFFAVIFLVFSILINVCFNFKIGIIESVSLKNISMYIVLFCIIFQRIFDKEAYGENKSIYTFVWIYLIYSLILIIYKNITGSNFNNLFDFLITFKGAFDAFIIFILLLYLNLNQDYLEKTIKMLLLVFFILNLITVLDALKLFDIDRIGFDAVHGRTSGAFGESNVYAAYVSLFLPLVIASLLECKNKLSFFYYSLNIILGVYSLILTGSRGGIVSFIVSFVFFLIIIKKSNLKIEKVAKVYIVLTIALTGLVLIYSIPRNITEGLENNIVSRYESSSLNEYSSGRIDLWKKSFNIFWENPLFGSSDSFSDIIGSNTHNTYLEIVISRGLVGLFLFLGIFYSIIRKVFSQKKIYNDYFLISYAAGFISFVISMVFLNMFSAYYYFFIYSALIVNRIDTLSSDSLHV